MHTTTNQKNGAAKAPTTLTDDGPSAEYLRIIALPPAELETLLVRGDTPDVDSLVGWEFRGTNTHPITSLVGIRKFVKGFFRGDDGKAYGYNSPVEQNALTEPWHPLRPGLRGGRALTSAEQKRFGFYRVEPVDASARDNRYLHALLLDYGKGGNPLLEPSAFLRDYLVRVKAGSDELLLGKAFVALGPVRIPVPRDYFVLERMRRADFHR